MRDAACLSGPCPSPSLPPGGAPGSALSTADLAYTDGLSAFWYYGTPVLIATFLMVVGAKAIRRVGYLTQAGGLAPIAAAAAAAGKDGYMDITSGTSRYAMYIITFGCAWMIQANVWQRISAARTDRDARKMTVLSFFAYIPLYLIVVLTGMAGLVLFPTLPQGGVVTAVVVNYLPPVLGAIAFVGISAAVMSTMDSLINTGVFVPLVAGFVWRRGNAPGAMASMVVGLSYCLYNLLISAGLPLPSFWAAQSAQQVILGVSLSAAVYVAVSLCTKPDYEKTDAFIAAANLLGRQKRPPQQG